MELRAKKSKIHLYAIAFIFIWGAGVILFSATFLLLKILFLVALQLALFLEFRAWAMSPEVISVRAEKLFLRGAEFDANGIQLSSCQAHLLWIKLPGRRALAFSACYLYRDSYAQSDWRALRRAVLHS